MHQEAPPPPNPLPTLGNTLRVALVITLLESGCGKGERGSHSPPHSQTMNALAKKSSHRFHFAEWGGAGGGGGGAYTNSFINSAKIGPAPTKI